MTLVQALILGIVQGATEFLPISSSGHLVLVPWLLAWDLDPRTAFVFDVLVQWGTLLAVIGFFRWDLLRLLRAAARGVLNRQPFETADARLAWLLLLASLPAVVVGLSLKGPIEGAFDRPAAVSAFLLVTAALLGLAERLQPAARPTEDIGPLDALWIGAAQALSLFPGVSRSGSTIAGGLTRGLSRAEAARFSFLMAVPVMLGAGVIALRDLAISPDAISRIPSLVLGFLAAAIVGYLSIRWLLAYLARRRLTVFIVYCAVVGSIGLLLSWSRG